MSVSFRDFASQLVALPFTESYTITVTAASVAVETGGNLWLYHTCDEGVCEHETVDGEPTITLGTSDEMLAAWRGWLLGEEPNEQGESCYECGAGLDDGEGWDGLCGNCADRTVKEESGSDYLA